MPSCQYQRSPTAPYPHKDETLRERARRLSNKADPGMAMREVEPSQLANDHSSSLQPLRNIVHKDMNGNPIVDPGRSNPTRSRWQTPLQTIRGFDAATNNTCERQSSSSDRTFHDGSRDGPADPMKPRRNNYKLYDSGANTFNYEGYDDHYGQGYYHGRGYKSSRDSSGDGYQQIGRVIIPEEEKRWFGSTFSKRM